MPRLVYLGRAAGAERDGVIGPEAAKVALVPGAALSIGRSNAADLRVRSGTVARIHATVSLMPGTADRLIVTDLRSTNGTWVRGKSEAVAILAPGEELLIAGTFRFRFEA